MDLYYILNIQTDHAILPGFKYPQPHSGHGVHWKYAPHEIFTDTWYAEFCDKISFIGVPSVILFYCAKSDTNDFTHIDINESHIPVTAVPAAFNWVPTGGAGSSMVWYNMHTFTDENLWYGKYDKLWEHSEPDRKSPAAAICRASSIQEINQITVSSTHLTLVKTDTMHRIVMGNEDRWCVSIRLPYNASSTWGDYVNLARDIIIK